MINYLNLLYGEMGEICDGLAPILKYVGIVYKGIQIVVPILLIIFGMLEFATAVTEKDEGAIKKAEKKLVNKAIAALLVFLTVTLVGVLMKLIGNGDYKDCMTCITNPFSTECKDLVEIAQSDLNF